MTLKGTDTVNKREQLAQWTSLVADTGDLDMIAELDPLDDFIENKLRIS